MSTTKYVVCAKHAPRFYALSNDSDGFDSGRLVTNLDEATLFDTAIAATVQFMDHGERRPASYWYALEADPKTKTRTQITADSHALGKFMQTCTVREVVVSLVLGMEIPTVGSR